MSRAEHEQDHDAGCPPRARKHPQGPIGELERDRHLEQVVAGPASRSRTRVCRTDPARTRRGCCRPAWRARRRETSSTAGFDRAMKNCDEQRQERELHARARAGSWRPLMVPPTASSRVPARRIPRYRWRDSSRPTVPQRLPAAGRSPRAGGIHGCDYNSIPRRSMPVDSAPTPGLWTRAVHLIYVWRVERCIRSLPRGESHALDLERHSRRSVWR